MVSLVQQLFPCGSFSTMVMSIVAAVAAIVVPADLDGADNGNWVQVVSVSGTAGQGNEIVTKSFELPQAAKIKIKWKLLPTGNAPQFRAQLSSWQDGAKDYVSAGVIVRAVGADTKEQLGNLGAGKHRVMFTMKRMKYSFTIHYQR